MDLIEQIKSRIEAGEFFVHLGYSTVSTLPKISARGWEEFHLDVPHALMIPFGEEVTRYEKPGSPHWEEVLQKIPANTLVEIFDHSELRIKGFHTFRKQVVTKPNGEVTVEWKYKGYVGE